MRKHFYVSLLGLFTLALMLSGFSGCGNNAQQATTEKKSTEQSAQTPTSPPPASTSSNNSTNSSSSSASANSSTSSSQTTPPPTSTATAQPEPAKASVIKAVFDEKAKPIMMAAAKVYGGLEKPIDLRDLMIESKATGPSPVGGQLTLDMTFYLKAPDKIKTITSGFLPGQKIVVGYDGKNGWTQVLSGTVVLQTKDLPKDQLRQLSVQLAQNLSRVNNPFIEAMKLEGYAFQYMETVTLDSSRADVIVLRSPDRKATKFFVEQKSHDIVRSEQSNGVETTVTVFGDFRELEGRRTPFLLRTLQDEKMVAEMQISTMKINSGMDDSLFAKPENK